MKFCEKCGKELEDDAIVCMGCGCLASPPKQEPTPQQTSVSPTDSKKDRQASKGIKENPPFRQRYRYKGFY